jgi:hypothetical protein
MANNGVIAGHAAKLYMNTGTNASPTWVLIEEVGDVSLPDLGISLAEVATRASAYIANLAGLFNFALEFEALHKGAPTVWDVLRARFFARTPTQFLIADGLVATSGTEGFKAYYFFEKFPIDQPLQGAQKNNVRLAPAYFIESDARVNPSWMVVS